MKMVILLSSLIALPVYAAQFKVLKKATDPKLQAMYKVVAPFFAQPDNCLEVSLVKVLKPTDARGRSPQELRMAMTKESIHRYVTHWFDDGIGLSVLKSAQEVQADFDRSDYFDASSEDSKPLLEGLKVLAGVSTFEVYAGSASGNNTIGELYAVYDLKNNEIASFVNSNFASDSGCGD